MATYTSSSWLIRAACLALLTRGAAADPITIYSAPNLQYASNTTKGCTAFYDNANGLTCHQIRDDVFHISPEDFTRWNPAVTLDCDNWKFVSYCVSVTGEITATSGSASESPYWQRVGCYKDVDTNNWTLKNLAFVGETNLTIEACQAACGTFLWAGVENGKECRCGDAIQSPDVNTNDTADCDLRCSGNDSQDCGGREDIYLYTSAADAADRWESLGCYVVEDSHVLRQQIEISIPNSHIACKNACNNAKYDYAGVQNGSECWCDDMVAVGSDKLTSKSECDKPCSGSADETCGGESRLEVFVKVVLDPYSSFNSSYTSVSSTKSSSDASATSKGSSEDVDEDSAAASLFADVKRPKWGAFIGLAILALQHVHI